MYINFRKKRRFDRKMEQLEFSIRHIPDSVFSLVLCTLRSQCAFSSPFSPHWNKTQGSCYDISDVIINYYNALIDFRDAML